MREAVSHEVLAQLLVSQESFSVNMPAGSGKSTRIARTTGYLVNQGHRVLILTHTHAGVDALRERLKTAAPNSDLYKVRTIDGWCYGLIRAYPHIGRIDVPETPNWVDSKSYHQAAVRVLGAPAIGTMITQSYDFLIVDEYQDCLIDQHNLIVAVRNWIPTAVFGDPLQSLFGFGNNQPVNWTTDVEAAFTSVNVPITPWRWHSINPDLGQWILGIRNNLETGLPIDLKSNAINLVHVPNSPAGRTSALQHALNFVPSEDRSLVVIGQYRDHCASFAKQFKGEIQLMEELEGKEMIRFANAIAGLCGPDLAVKVIEFAKRCATGIPNILPKRAIDRLREGSLPSTRNPSLVPLFTSLASLISESRPKNIATTLVTIMQSPGVEIYCYEAYTEVLQALERTDIDPTISLAEAITRSRNKLRNKGRVLENRVASRPLLIKGLEFDHVIILDAERFKVEELYVALSRGRKSVTVLSQRSVLSPHPSVH